MKNYNEAIVGPLGVVGKEATEILVKHNFPISKNKFLITSKNSNREITFNDEVMFIEVAQEDAFTDVEIYCR